MSELRHAVRALRSNLAFTAAALAVLAVGIGANSAMFAFTDAVLLKPLPVLDPARLVVLGSVERDSPGADCGFSYPGYTDLRDGVSAFSGVSASSGFRASVSLNGENQRCDGELVSGNYFATLGVRPHLGRLLVPADDRVPGGHPVAVLDFAFWPGLGADRGLIGRDLVINGRRQRWFSARSTRIAA
jgi:hypothetical protein